MGVDWLGIIILSVVLGVVLFAYERALSRIRSLQRERTNEEKKARSEAVTLVRQAREKAAEIIGEAKVDAAKWQEVMDAEMDKLTKAELGEYKERLQKISIDIEQDVKNETGELKKALEEETLGVEKSVAEKLEKGMAEVEQEVTKFKQARFEQINEKAGILLEAVVRKVFTKSVRLSDHEELIIRALEEAKAQNAI